MWKGLCILVVVAVAVTTICLTFFGAAIERFEPVTFVVGGYWVTILVTLALRCAVSLIWPEKVSGNVYRREVIAGRGRNLAKGILATLALPILFFLGGAIDVFLLGGSGIFGAVCVVVGILTAASGQWCAWASFLHSDSETFAEC